MASSNPAEIRGAIQRGSTGDKRPGFDPALAPLETDSEAGGVPFSSDQTATALDGQSKGASNVDAGSYNDAMRRGDGAPAPDRGSGSLMIYLAIAGIAAMFVAAVAIVGIA